MVSQGGLIALIFTAAFNLLVVVQADCPFSVTARELLAFCLPSKWDGGNHSGPHTPELLKVTCSTLESLRQKEVKSVS